MKKKLLVVCFPRERLLKLLLKMKLLTLLMFLGLAAASGSTYSQQTKFSLRLNSVSVKEVFKAIEENSEFIILYNEKTLDVNREVDVKVKNETIESILNQVFDGTKNVYKIYDRQIVILENKNSEVPEFFKGKEEQQPQKKTISGTVTDTRRQPLSGVSVLIKGTTTGTITDANGNFILQIPADAITLLFSFVGMKSQEVDIEGKASINILMEEEILGIEEVVAVGYGTLVKRNVTGAMTVVPMKKIKESNVNSVSEALVGMSPGVQVNQITGVPGAAPSIRIRGVGSITAGNEPLFVIDGFPIGDDALSNFNINDIESISILKDASATSIYGSRGANGVILISTKRGKAGSPKVSVETYFGFQKVTKKLDVLSPEEFVEFTTDAVNNAWAYLGHDPNDQMSTRPAFYQNPSYYSDTKSWGRTDWQDEIYRVAPIHNTQLSLSGGTEAIRYKICGSFFDQKGIIKNSNFKRYALSANLDADISKRLRLSVAMNSSKVDNKKVNDNGQWNTGIIGTALALPGFFATRNQDGSYPSFQGLGFSVSTVYNPMTFINENDDRVDQYRVLGNVSVEYDIIKGLYFKSLFGFDYYDVKENFFQNSWNYNVPSVSNYSPGTIKATGSFNTNSTFNWLSENTLNYSLKWNETNSLNALLGMTAQKAASELSSISATNFPDNTVPTLNAGQVTAASTTKSEWSMLSYLSRLNYGYMDKYFLTISLRADGSSRFGGQNKWGYFPSVSVGWITSEERFLKNSSLINYLKVRASYGYSGNNSIPNYGSIGLLSYSNYVLGGKIISGLVPSSLSNADLGWELSKQFNAGAEFGFWKDRIKLITDVYQSISDNLLLNVPVPSILGVTSSLQNIGRVRNRGLEFSLATQNITGKFNWTTDFNISFNRNKVLELGPSGVAIRSSSNQESNITQVGRPIGDFYGYIFEGVYNTQDEINNHPHLATDRPGDPIVKDVNKDGQITVDDRTVLGNYQPNFNYALTNTFRFGGFDLSIFIQGVNGNEIMNLGMRQSASMTGRTNSLGLARERWRSPSNPGNGKVFKASIDVYGVRRDPSTFYMDDGSYLRFRNITLGYDFKPSFLKKIKAIDARVYISSENPFTFTKYSGYNPEISSYNSSLTPGIDYFGYPLSKNLVIGINITF